MPKNNSMCFSFTPGGTFTELTRPTTGDGAGREGVGSVASMGMVGGTPGVVGNVDDNQVHEYYFLS